MLMSTSSSAGPPAALPQPAVTCTATRARLAGTAAAQALQQLLRALLLVQRAVVLRHLAPAPAVAVRARIPLFPLLFLSLLILAILIFLFIAVLPLYAHIILLFFFIIQLITILVCIISLLLRACSAGPALGLG